MNDQSLTHEQKVERFLAVSALVQVQILNILTLESKSMPQDSREKIFKVVRDANKMIDGIL